MTSNLNPIGDSEVHLFCASDEIGDECLLAKYIALLTIEDQQRHARLRFDHSRRQFLVARALVRFVLSNLTGEAPERFVFATDRWGKPIVVQPVEVTLAFNIAHTSGLVVCAVTRAETVGVDVEQVRSTYPAFKIAERFFSTAEVDALRTLPDTLRRDRFFDYWTLKEAYAKGRGMGLSLPFNQFTIDLNDRSGPSVSVAPEFDDDCRWGLRLLSLSTGHRLAAAVRLPRSPSVFDFKLHMVVPFASL